MPDESTENTQAVETAQTGSDQPAETAMTNMAGVHVAPTDEVAGPSPEPVMPETPADAGELNAPATEPAPEQPADPVTVPTPENPVPGAPEQTAEAKEPEYVSRYTYGVYVKGNAVNQAFEIVFLATAKSVNAAALAILKQNVQDIENYSIRLTKIEVMDILRPVTE